MTTSPQTQTLHLLAPAKVNLVLRVVGRRDDGYHELETWMQKVSLYDELTLTITGQPGIEMSCSDVTLPCDDGNLVFRAADLFFSNSLMAREKGCIIHLEKRIPLAAGLGGGSSDAGTVLRGLNAFFSDEFSEGQLIELAKGLGADVPFFVTGAQSVLATGIGEKMEEVAPLRDCTFVLANPGIRVSTAAIFAKFALTTADKNSTLTGFHTLRSDDLNISILENDLEEVTTALFPVIGNIKEELRNHGADAVLMSGSGSTVFGVFAGEREKRIQRSEIAVSRLRQKYGKNVFITE